MVDDVLDLEGVPHEVGKRLGHDLAEGKTTLPLALALEQDGRELQPLLVDARAGDTLAAARSRARRRCARLRRARAFALRRPSAGSRELGSLPPGERASFSRRWCAG